MPWYKGSLHAHSTESDGDESPERVAQWFDDHDYDFLVLSDHNVRTVIEGGLPSPLMIPGEEITVQIEGQEKAVYVNAVSLPTVVEPINADDDVLATVQANVNAVLDAGGVPSLGAPYFRDGFDHKTLTSIRGAMLMEIYNAHPMNVVGNPQTFSYEDIWDAVLTSGHAVWGTATDDSHNYREFSADQANPGRAWVVVRAPELSEDAIVQGLKSGDFYGSTGVSLRSVQRSKSAVYIEVEVEKETMYRTYFVGRDGRTLAEVSGPAPIYEIEGDEGYVRARVRSTTGARAWTQPVFVGS